MKIHEYQAKEILRRYGVRTPRGQVIDSPEAARAIAEEYGGRCVVKAQIHAGGRGKGGGVKVAKTPDEAVAYAGKILGMQLITHQTGPEGQEVRKVLIEEAADIAQELYVAITLDRASGKPTIMASKFGGMDIEEVAHDNPEAILFEAFDPHLGLIPSRRGGSPPASASRAAPPARRATCWSRWPRPSSTPTPPSPRSTR